jgi:hypothetical protein
MIKIELSEATRSNRNKWVWTEINTQRANDVLHLANEYEPWWPVKVRSIYYKLISSPLCAQTHWRQFGNRKRPFIDYDSYLTKLIKWMRIYEKLPWHAITDEHRITTGKVGFTNTDEFIDQEMGDFLEGYVRCTARRQSRYLEVWIESATLFHIVKPIADEFCSRVVVCRGYNSVTFQSDFYKRATEAMRLAQTPTILYFGDWNPSGVNMLYAAVQTLEDELGLYGVEYYRCGINPEHFDKIPADPVPIKPKDKRAKKFIEQHGPTAYELDAFHPKQLQALVRESLERFTDMQTFNEDKEKEGQDYVRLVRLKMAVENVVNNSM